MEAGEWNTHHVTLGDSNPKARTPSIDTRMGDLTMESVKSGKDASHQPLMDFSGAYGSLDRTFVLTCSWA